MILVMNRLMKIQSNRLFLSSLHTILRKLNFKNIKYIENDKPFEEAEILEFCYKVLRRQLAISRLNTIYSILSSSLYHRIFFEKYMITAIIKNKPMLPNSNE